MSADLQTAKTEKEEVSDEQKPIATSYFFEKHAIWVLLFFLIIGILYRFVPLVLVSTFLIFLSVFITAWKKQSLKNIEIGLESSKTRIFVGEDFQIHSSIYNDKWLPLIWIEWEFPQNKYIMIGEEIRDTYLIRFLWLLMFKRVEWTVSAKALHRGVYQAGHVKLRSGDGFRFAETEKTFALDKLIYVYPKLVSVHVPAFHPTMQWEIKGKNGGFLEDPLLIKGIREYQPGDEMRRFNGRASARTGKLQTNVYQPVVTEELMIYVDIAGFNIDPAMYTDDEQEKQAYRLKQKESFESFLSVIASILVKYHEQGIRIGYSSNSLSFQGERMAPVIKSSDLRPILDVMAKSTERQGSHFEKNLPELLYKHKLAGPLFIFCESVKKAHVRFYEQYKNIYPSIQFYYQKESSMAGRVRAKNIDTFLSSAARAKGS